MDKTFFIFYDLVFKFDKTFSTEIGGVQKYLYELSKIIKSLGFQVNIIQFGHEKVIDVYNDINIIQLDFKGKGKYEQAVKYIDANYKLNFERHIIIWGSDTISIPIQKKLKSISIQHGIACDMVQMDTSAIKKIIEKAGFTSIYKYFQRRNARKFFNNSTYKVCVDYNYLNWYRTYSDLNSDLIKGIKVIPNFSKIPLNTIVKERKETIRIGFARRFVYKRGVKLMCKVVPLLLDKYPNLEFVFAGDGPLKSDIIRLKEKYLNNITITSFTQEETFAFHANIDIAVIPTIGSEGTSLSLLEAMASKTAIICTNVGGLTNVVINNFNGLLINPDVEDLFTSLETLIINSEFRKKLAENAYMTVSQGFNYDIWKKNWTDMIMKVVKE